MTLTNLKKKLLYLLKDEQGSMMPLVAFVCFLVGLGLGAGLELWRVHTTADGVNEAVRNSLMKANVQTQLYSGEKDLIAGGFTYNDYTGGWDEQADVSALPNMLANNLHLVQSGTDWISRTDSGREKYCISGLTIAVDQPAVSSDAPTGSTGIKLTATFTLKIPIVAGIPATISVPMKIPVGTLGKF